MSHTSNEELLSVNANYGTRLQLMTLVIVLGLLVLTATGNAGLMFWLSLGATLILAIWLFPIEKYGWL